MSLTQAQILEAALALPRESKLELAEQILDSIDRVDSAEIDAAWVAEAKRRLDELNRGEAHTIPAEQVFARIRAGRKS
jgi:putative addiction module component (TIGR02574 family)